MKGNNGEGNNIGRDLWETPKDLFKELSKQYIFYFDCCANETNTKCVLFSDDFEKEKEKINGVCWMNPPFSKSKIMFEHFFKVAESGVAIYRSDNLETSIWQDIILKSATWVYFLKGRINYEGFSGKSSRFPSALIGFNLEVPKNLNGVVLKIK